MEFKEIQLNGTTLVTGSGKAIFDSGSSYILLDSSTYGNFKKKIDAFNISGLDCDSTSYCTSSSSCDKIVDQLPTIQILLDEIFTFCFFLGGCS